MSANDPSGYVIDPEAQRQDARTDREQLIWATFCAAGIEALAGGTEPMLNANAAAALADAGLEEFRRRWPA